jgi:hypothetical protein
MEDDSKQERPSGNTTTHDPLPYVVRLRIAMTDDAVPEVRELHVTAYSIHEAWMQAVLEATGSGVVDIATTKVQVEFIGPDEPAYWLKMLGNAFLQGAVKEMERNRKK